MIDRPRIRFTHFTIVGKIYDFAADDPVLHNKWIQIVKGLKLTPAELATFAKEQLQIQDHDKKQLIDEEVDVATVLSLADSTKLVSTYGLSKQSAAEKLFSAFHPKPGLSTVLCRPSTNKPMQNIQLLFRHQQTQLVCDF